LRRLPYRLHSWGIMQEDIKAHDGGQFDGGGR